MIRGKCAAHAAKQLWLHDSLLVDGTFPGYLLSWIAKVGQTVNPVFVWTQQPKELSAPLIINTLAYATYADAIADCRRRAEVLHMVVGHSNLIGAKAILWTPDTKQYKVGRYGCAKGILF